MSESADERKRIIDDYAAAAAFRDSLITRADGWDRDVYPWWHGWAIHEAYMAGLKAERERKGNG